MVLGGTSDAPGPHKENISSIDRLGDLNSLGLVPDQAGLHGQLATNCYAIPAASLVAVSSLAFTSDFDLSISQAKLERHLLKFCEKEHIDRYQLFASYVVESGLCESLPEVPIGIIVILTDNVSAYEKYLKAEASNENVHQVISELYTTGSSRYWLNTSAGIGPSVRVRCTWFSGECQSSGSIFSRPGTGTGFLSLLTEFGTVTATCSC
ncbi:hypothetical protein PSTG_15605 [Puccinia striiformis f. sp. tritici PST-78]|uniref:Uncharacterized protein n=1 Tax=Puccinia striiformis f. sp. tritici PST-78 TaxID=1165861 RepID=A0A0L0UW78_9BASI|nr:hypothetical protein PSTG_15605 [Puccinia striiformis f. sp. tritici PST-78]